MATCQQVSHMFVAHLLPVVIFYPNFLIEREKVKKKKEKKKREKISIYI